MRRPATAALLLSAASLATLVLTGCLASPTASGPGAKIPANHKLPSQNVELPYQFAIDGFDVRVSSAEFATDVSAWEHTVTDPLADDERWLSLGVTVGDTLGHERRFPWITMVRVRTALGEIDNASHGLSQASGEMIMEERVLAPNAKEELRYFFRVKRGDFPIDIVFADGATAPLGR